MKEIRYTETQKEIIKNREALETMRYYLLNGFAFDNSELRPAFEKTLNDCLSFMVERTAQLRKSQQETFNRMPWLANMCGRV